jgi:hypothetical protein
MGLFFMPIWAIWLPTSLAVTLLAVLTRLLIKRRA